MKGPEGKRIIYEHKKPTKKIRYSIVIIGLTLLCVMIGIFVIRPYYTVNKLTKEYGYIFENLYAENGFYAGIEYLKVIQYQDKKAEFHYFGYGSEKKKLNSLDENYAVILYVERGHSSASLFTFKNEADQWKFESWDLLWSVSGNGNTHYTWPWYP